LTYTIPKKPGCGGPFRTAAASASWVAREGKQHYDATFHEPQ
jgi:hypothetical protein